MSPTIGGRGWWWLVTAYALGLLSTQSGLGIAVDAFKDRWGASALDATMTVGVLLGGVTVIALMIPAWRRCTAGERSWLLVVLALYGVGTWALEIPQERLHYVEYGLLAALVYIGRAVDATPLEPDRLLAPEGAGVRGAIAVAVLATAGIGLLDEILQGWLWPRRYFDWRDVQLNLRAALLGVAAAVPWLAGWRRRTGE